jgi:hypothetical protein
LGKIDEVNKQYDELEASTKMCIEDIESARADLEKKTEKY